VAEPLTGFNPIGTQPEGFAGDLGESLRVGHPQAFKRPLSSDLLETAPKGLLGDLTADLASRFPWLGELTKANAFGSTDVKRWRVKLKTHPDVVVVLHSSW
jgi:hypothetical protein